MSDGSFNQEVVIEKKLYMPLKFSILLLLTGMIVLSVPGTGYFLMMNAQNAILKEKQNKLFALAKLMDLRLKGSFDEILLSAGSQDAPRSRKIALLNSILRADTDAIADAEPGIGVGYYSRQLDAIITYGPSRELGHKVGQSISQTHQGRRVMETGQKMVQTAVLVRGNIMNCMYPVIRDKETIGYIWANELVEDINHQTEKLRNKFYAIIFMGVLISFVVSTLIAGAVANKVKLVKNGLKAIQEDLDYRIISRKGEIGEIITAINEMAAALSKRKKQFLNPLPVIPIDEEQIRQVFINLIINAAQAMENGGQLLITTETTADDFIRIHIEDSGHGIEQENIKRLSDPFFTTRENGTGL